MIMEIKMEVMVRMDGRQKDGSARVVEVGVLVVLVIEIMFRKGPGQNGGGDGVEDDDGTGLERKWRIMLISLWTCL